MSPEYIDYIGETDNDVRTIVDAVKEAGISDKTMIMIVSDHGGDILCTRRLHLRRVYHSHYLLGKRDKEKLSYSATNIQV